MTDEWKPGCTCTPAKKSKGSLACPIHAAPHPHIGGGMTNTEDRVDWRKLYNAAKRSRDDMALDLAHMAKRWEEAQRLSNNYLGEIHVYREENAKLREKLAEAERDRDAAWKETETLRTLPGVSTLRNAMYWGDKFCEAEKRIASLEQQVERLVKERDALRALLLHVSDYVLEAFASDCNWFCR